MTDENNSNSNSNSQDTAEMRIPVSYSSSPHSHTGPMLSVLVIMLVLVLGGLYLWGGMLSEKVHAPTEESIVNNEPETIRAKADAEMLQTLSPSDELSSLEADLSSTNFDSFESDIVAIDVELNAPTVQ
jgi:hypothetical protein